MLAFASQIGGRHQPITSKLPLDHQVPLVRLRGLQVGWQINDRRSAGSKRGSSLLTVYG